MSCPTLQDCQTLQATADANELVWMQLFEQSELAYTLFIESQLLAEQCWEEYLTCQEGEGEGEQVLSSVNESLPSVQRTRAKIAHLENVLSTRKPYTEEQKAACLKLIKKMGQIGD